MQGEAQTIVRRDGEVGWAVVDAIFRAAGGLGLFLLGMSLLNDGLQKLASRAVTGRLAGWTDRPLRGALTGMVGTALIQSSTATTVTAVGLVGAGLMSFRQALGVIFGANVGTTITGWMVALFGFQLQLGEIALPLVLVAALLRLAGRHRAHTFATALGGFALVFVGISVLQAGLAGLTDRITPASFPPDTVAGRLQLVALGTLVTLVTQSSSAGVAVALTGVHVGTVTLGQAAALVIGMDIGTTATALAASIGRSVAARRTGLAHLIFNLFTAAAAFALWPLYHAAWNMLAPPTLHSQAEIALVGFHTLFNLIGLAAVLPLTSPFARLITWFVPQRGGRPTERLDSSLLTRPALGVSNVRATLNDLTLQTFAALDRSLASPDAEASDTWEALQQDLSQTQRFLSQIDIRGAPANVEQEVATALHVIDHLTRLIERSQHIETIRSALGEAELADWTRALRAGLSPKPSTASAPKDVGRQLGDAEQRLEVLWEDLDRNHEPLRQKWLAEAAQGGPSIRHTLTRLDALRWLRRTTAHAWRIAHYLISQYMPSTY